MTIHTAFKKGQKVFCILKDGKKIIDQFEENGSGYVELRDAGKIKLKKIRSLTIYRGSSGQV